MTGMKMSFEKTLFLTGLLGVFILFPPGFTAAQANSGNAASVLEIEEDRPAPPNREELENLVRANAGSGKQEGLPIDIRLDAMREAALSYGARGGLAWRTFHVRQELELHARSMDKVFDFRQLLIAAPSGLLIEPPIISEAENSLIIEKGGTEAAVADRLYEISRNAQIVSAPRHWRNYLEREWGEVTPPPDLLRPANEEEREQWIGWIREGWNKGVEQADDIFRDDVNQLTADYKGMVRYRMLLSQKMISPPYALQVDRGVTGGGNTMRVGDRAVQITGMPALSTEAEKWQPANR